MNRVTNAILWAVFLSLLLVLLPHTAWMFSMFEPAGATGTAAAWGAAFAFEAAIAVLVHRLARHWEAQPKGMRPWAKRRYRWANAYFGGLVIALLVSSLANLAHSVEFGRALAIFGSWGIPPQVYQVATGAILPMTSLLFARVLSYEVETEEGANPEVEKLKQDLAEIRRRLAEAENARKKAEAAEAAANARFDAAGDLLAALTGEGKRQRILAVSRQWPQLQPGAIAVISGASASYVTEVLQGAEVAG